MSTVILMEERLNEEELLRFAREALDSAYAPPHRGTITPEGQRWHALGLSMAMSGDGAAWVAMHDAVLVAAPSSPGPFARSWRAEVVWVMSGNSKKVLNCLRTFTDDPDLLLLILGDAAAARAYEVEYEEWTEERAWKLASAVWALHAQRHLGLVELLSWKDLEGSLCEDVGA